MPAKNRLYAPGTFVTASPVSVKYEAYRFGETVMHVRRFFLTFLLAAAPSLASAQEPVSVMIVGTFHMANPGKDIHDSHADDVLAPKRQAEIRATVDGLARFRPTEVDLEWSAAGAAKYYAQYLKGTLKPRAMNRYSSGSASRSRRAPP